MNHFALAFDATANPSLNRTGRRRALSVGLGWRWFRLRRWLGRAG